MLDLPQSQQTNKKSSKERGIAKKEREVAQNFHSHLFRRFLPEVNEQRIPPTAGCLPRGVPAKKNRKWIFQKRGMRKEEAKRKKNEMCRYFAHWCWRKQVGGRMLRGGDLVHRRFQRTPLLSIHVLTNVLVNRLIVNSFSALQPLLP